jgi:hypothetical protein
LFGHKENKENMVNPEEKVVTGVVTEILGRTAKAVLSGGSAVEAANVMAGKKSLVESLQVTDKATWSEVKGRSGGVLDSLATMGAALEVSSDARAVVDGLISR